MIYGKWGNIYSMEYKHMYFKGIIEEPKEGNNFLNQSKKYLLINKRHHDMNPSLSL